MEALDRSVDGGRLLACEVLGTTRIPCGFLGSVEMPSKTRKQARTMRWAAHDRGFAKRMGIPQRVAREFVAADKRRGRSRRRKT